MADFILIAIIVAGICTALVFIIKKRKKGNCMSCPYSSSCSKNKKM